MWFDAQKVLAEIEGGDVPLSTAPVSRLSQVSQRSCPKAESPPHNVAGVANVATPLAQNRKSESPVRGDMQTPKIFPHGLSCAGRPLTWTGRIVSLDEWRRLTAWERDGPRGRIWNGITKQWQRKEGEQND